MSEPHKVHRYARVARPYESVRGILHGLLVHGEAPAPLVVHTVLDQHHVAGLPDLTRATLGVEDATPLEWMQLTSAEIYASSLSASETQLEIEAHCIDRAGCTMDATTRRAAEIHYQALLESVVERIRRSPETSPEPPAHDA